MRHAVVDDNRVERVVWWERSGEHDTELGKTGVEHRVTLEANDREAGIPHRASEASEASEEVPARSAVSRGPSAPAPKAPRAGS